jgi:hypothetical protein
MDANRHFETMSQIVTPGKFVTIYYHYPFKVLLQINAANGCLWWLIATSTSIWLICSGNSITQILLCKRQPGCSSELLFSQGEKLADWLSSIKPPMIKLPLTFHLTSEDPPYLHGNTTLTYSPRSVLLQMYTSLEHSYYYYSKRNVNSLMMSLLSNRHGVQTTN